MPIEGKVAEILDKYTLVANIGKEEDVEEGMEFEIYDEGPMITDPETGEELGKPETVKITVVASDVKENMTVMTTESYTYQYDPMQNLLGSFGTKTKTTKRELKTDEHVTDDRKKVRVGDSLRQVIEEETDETD